MGGAPFTIILSDPPVNFFLSSLCNFGFCYHGSPPKGGMLPPEVVAMIH